MTASGAENWEDAGEADGGGPSVPVGDATEFEEWLDVMREPEDELRIRLSSELEAYVLGEAI